MDDGTGSEAMGRRALAPSSVLRGEVWLADVGLDEAKRFVIVSNNQRNRSLRSVLGVRMTTARKPDLPTVVEFAPGETGRSRSSVVADDIVGLLKEDLVRKVGALTFGQMSRVENALRAALALA